VRASAAFKASAIEGDWVMNWFRRALFGENKASSRSILIEAEGIARKRSDVPSEERARELDRVEDDSHGDPDSPMSLERSLHIATQWRVAKALLALRDQVNQMAPNRSKASDGTIGDERHCGGAGASDHCPNVQDGNVGVVTAMDITHDVQHGCDAGALAESIRASQDPRVKYIIWNRQIANSSPIQGQPAWAWRAYTGSNPHNKHVHISVKATKQGPGGYDTTSAWNIAVVGAIA
jgi:hypothetical protein